MALKSMTGFARLTGTLAAEQTNNLPEVSQNNQTHPSFSWTIELRSVNGKGLDLRLRMPVGMEALEQKLKKHLNSQLGRGNVSFNLNLVRQQSSGRIELNETAFNDLVAAAKRAASLSGLNLPDLSILLQNKSVLVEKEQMEDEEQQQKLHAAIFDTAMKAINALITAREEEGRALTNIIQEKIDKIRSLTNEATSQAKLQEVSLQEKLKQAVANLIEDTSTLDENRLEQEAMLLVVKADINEELDRLRAHIDQAEDLISRDEPVGRRLDFLCQEFNREANTLCSKSASKELTYLGLELKTVIDQLREQVQNIE